MSASMRSGLSDILLALFVVAVAAMLLVPLPTMLLDVLLVVNLSVSLLLLLAGLYMSNPLALLAFPSLLLLTTLFRLGLNVASTRLILSNGYAGQVIEAFGSFLIRGEIVVGVIIFMIVTIVSFIVIARGASRVSEVAARFALDALPGKQMAIDADLRAGLINAGDAQRRREELRQESQLYGAMDGAMKFVQGDAIAGFFIIFTNIVGGLYLGVSRGQSFSDAIQTYSLLTIGDGLVSQIPALLISICAGIVVTRVSSGEHSTLGGDVGAQLFARPITLAIAALVLVVIGLLPGLPVIPFFFIAALLGYGSYALKKRQQNTASIQPLKRDFSPGLMLPFSSGGEVEDSGDGDRLQLSLDAAVLYRTYRAQTPRLRQYVNDFRIDFYEETGIRLPDVAIVADDLLTAGSYKLSMNGSILEHGTVPIGSVMVELHPESAVAFGLEVIEESLHPCNGSLVSWVSDGSAVRAITEAAQIRVFDFFGFITLRLGAFAQRHPEEFLSLSDVHTLLKSIEKKHPGLLADSFTKQFMSAARFTDLARRLVKEKISIRDFKSIVEIVARYCATDGAEYVDDQIFDIEHCAAFVRSARRRHIFSRMLTPRGTLRVVTLAPELHQQFEDSATEEAGLSPQVRESIRRTLEVALLPLQRRGVSDLALLCSADARRIVRSILSELTFQPNLVSYDELDSSITLESIGVLGA